MQGEAPRLHQLPRLCGGRRLCAALAWPCTFLLHSGAGGNGLDTPFPPLPAPAWVPAWTHAPARPCAGRCLGRCSHSPTSSECSRRSGPQVTGMATWGGGTCGWGRWEREGSSRTDAWVCGGGRGGRGAGRQQSCSVVTMMRMRIVVRPGGGGSNRAIATLQSGRHCHCKPLSLQVCMCMQPRGGLPPPLTAIALLQKRLLER